MIQFYEITPVYISFAGRRITGAIVLPVINLADLTVALPDLVDFEFLVLPDLMDLKDFALLSLTDLIAFMLPLLDDLADLTFGIFELFKNRVVSIEADRSSLTLFILPLSFTLLILFLLFVPDFAFLIFNIFGAFDEFTFNDLFDLKFFKIRVVSAPADHVDLIELLDFKDLTIGTFDDFVLIPFAFLTFIDFVDLRLFMNFKLVDFDNDRDSTYEKESMVIANRHNMYKFIMVDF